MIKILIADDEQRTCQYMGDFFRERNHITFSVTDALEVLPLVEKEQPQIVLLDIRMPELDGLTILKEIKKKYKDRIKVILVSIADDEETQKYAFDNGADAFIKKPFTTDYLETVVMQKIEELLAYREKEELHDNG